MRPFAPEFILAVLPELLPFLSVTLAVVAGTIVFGSLFGGLLAAGQLGGRRLFRWLARVYIYLIRCTPPSASPISGQRRSAATAPIARP